MRQLVILIFFPVCKYLIFKELILTARSSHVRGHEGPQLLNTEPGMSEHELTEKATISINNYYKQT